MKTIELPFKVKRPVLACGADLKGAFALAKGGRIYLAEGFGPLTDPDNLEAYEASMRACEKKLGIKPSVIACDMHPDYTSGRLAAAMARRTAARLCRVQHHEAHIASAIAEHSIKTDVIGVAFDGTGYGRDGHIWGGEFFVGSPKRFRRAAHLEYVPMPGGDAAAAEPWRMAISFLCRAFSGDLVKRAPALMKNIGKKRLSVVRKMIDGRINSPLTSSAGRLFDAAACLILGRMTASFEAELPMELEKTASRNCDGCYGFGTRTPSAGGELIVETSGAFKGIVKDLKAKAAPAVISAKFHNTVAAMIAKTSSALGKRYALRRVVLSGGVFQNRYLTARAASLLRKNGFEVYLHSGVATNDYGIPAGQSVIANARVSCV